MKTLYQKLNELSSKRQKKIEARTARLVAEETARRELPPHLAITALNEN
jgi:hypothetical protein